MNFVTCITLFFSFQNSTYTHTHTLVTRKKPKKVPNENSMHLSISKFHLFAHCVFVCLYACICYFFFIFVVIYTRTHIYSFPSLVDFGWTMVFKDDDEYERKKQSFPKGTELITGMLLLSHGNRSCPYTHSLCEMGHTPTYFCCKWVLVYSLEQVYVCVCVCVRMCVCVCVSQSAYIHHMRYEYVSRCERFKWRTFKQNNNRKKNKIRWASNLWMRR